MHIIMRNKSYFNKFRSELWHTKINRNKTCKFKDQQNFNTIKAIKLNFNNNSNGTEQLFSNVFLMNTV